MQFINNILINQNDNLLNKINGVQFALINDLDNTSNNLVDYINNIDISNDLNDTSNKLLININNISNNLINYVNEYDFVLNIDNQILNGIDEKITINSNELINHFILIWIKKSKTQIII